MFLTLRWLQDCKSLAKVESRRARRERRRRELPPRRPVPTDLWGRCFNCLSKGHQASCCRSRPRCFSCRGLGHRSRACPSRRPGVASSAATRPRSQLVWRPVALSGSATGSMSATMVAVPVVEPAEGAAPRKRKRRRGPRRPRRAGGKARPSDGGSDDDGSSDPHPSLAGLQERVVSSGSGPTKPHRILDRSVNIRRREDELARALVVTVIGDLPAGAAELVRSSIALRFEVEEDRLLLHRWGPAARLASS